MQPTAHILLVDDEPELTTPLHRVLTHQGYGVSIANDGNQGWQMAQQGIYHLLILDWILPHVTGLDICRQLRDQGDRTPILLLTARDTLDDRVTGLDSGADDYLVKPFELQELLARVRALLRRQAPMSSERLTYRDLTLDEQNCLLYRSDTVISLSDKECQLLAYFLRHPRQLLTHRQICDHVWANSPEPPTSNALSAQIRLLRRKIDTHPHRSLIHTVYGRGYRFGGED
jgi:OmpR-family two-component system manganese-sensing response regulator